MMHIKTKAAAILFLTILCAVPVAQAFAAEATRPAFLQPRAFSWNSLADPENVFWPGYLWMWNGPLEPNVIREQLQDMAAHDARSVCVLAMPPEFRPQQENNQMDVDYLSPEFFDRIKVAVEESARLGMNYWIFDEGGWPSGHATGRVVQARPDLSRYVMSYNNGVWARQNVGGADGLNPEATETFIALTHQRYAEAVGSYFGNTIKLTFTDEPAYPAAGPGNRVPWTDGADALFQDRFGYSLQANLSAFQVTDLAQLTQAQKQVRVDAFDFWSGRFRDAYAVLATT